MAARERDDGGAVALNRDSVVAANWGCDRRCTCRAVGVAFNFFFLPPVLTFTIGDERNWVALLAFLMTASSRVDWRASTKQAKIARRRQLEAERLYEFCQKMLVTGNVIDLLNQLPQMIAANFNLRELCCI